MESEIGSQIPELGVHKVMVTKIDDLSVKLQIIGYTTWIIQVTRKDLLDLNIIDVFQEALAA
jgi:hypothetical protein